VYIDNEGTEIDIDKAFNGKFEEELESGTIKLTEVDGDNTFLVTGTLMGN